MVVSFTERAHLHDHVEFVVPQPLVDSLVRFTFSVDLAVNKVGAKTQFAELRDDLFAVLRVQRRGDDLEPGLAGLFPELEQFLA